MTRLQILPIILMILSAFLYSLMYLDVKLISTQYNPWTVIFFRGTSGFITGLLIALFFQIKPLFGIKTKQLLLRGILGGAAISLSFLSMSYLSLSIGTTIVSTSPLWTALFSVFLKRKVWHKIDTLATILCLIGLGIITSFNYNDRNFLIYILFALLSAILQGGVNVMIDEIKDENTIIISLYAMFGSIDVSITGFIYEQVKTPLMYSNHIWQLCLTGFLSLGAQALKTKAIQVSDGLGVIIFRYLDVPFSMMWDTLILQTKLNLSDYICIAFIMCGISLCIACKL
jgi:drug/metabolite transporter (DMT)-like permease